MKKLLAPVVHESPSMIVAMFRTLCRARRNGGSCRKCPDQNDVVIVHPLGAVWNSLMYAPWTAGTKSSISGSAIRPPSRKTVPASLCEFF